MDQAGLAAWYDTCRGLLLSLTVERMLQETETSFEKTSSTIRIIDDAGAVCRIYRHQKQHTLRDEISGPYPILQSWTPTAV